jgi:hypothetical protein
MKFLLVILIGMSNVAMSTTLQQQWEIEKRLGLRAEVDSKLLEGRHVIFVAGIMNELANIISNYYPSNIEAAKEFGATTSYIHPNSSNPIPENAELLYRSITDIYQRLQKPIILVGHSKGGAETLYAILKHPELITQGMVDRVLLIQAAIGGSPLAEDQSWCFKVVCGLLNPNLKTLKPDIAKRNFDDVFWEFDRSMVSGQRRMISDRIFYVRSQIAPNDLSFGISLIRTLTNLDLSLLGPNDGLITITAQYDFRIGVDLGILQSDHIGLTVSTVSSTSHEDRKSFMRALFKTVL